MGEVVTERQMLVEELQRELRWIEANLADGRGSQVMRDRKARIRDELERLRKES
jgi:hypothetical protein